jgi:hypothetical protein
MRLEKVAEDKGQKIQLLRTCCREEGGTYIRWALISLPSSTQLLFALKRLFKGRGPNGLPPPKTKNKTNT